MGEDYLYAWGIYLVCSLGVFLCFWYLTRRFYFWLKLPLRVVLAVVLWLPWQADPGVEGLAPAWLTTLFDGLLKHDVTIGRAGGPLLLVLLAALLLSLVVLYLHYRKRSS